MEIKLDEILKRLPVLSVHGNVGKVIKNVTSLDISLGNADLAWVSNKNRETLRSVTQGTIICSSAIENSFFNTACTYLVVENPRLYFLNVLKEFFYEIEPPSLSPHAVIHETTKIGKGVSLAAGVVIEKNCEIGDDTSIDANTVLKKNTKVGKNVKIGANCTVGGNGFGYEKDENGEYEFIPHIGNVVIEDFVEIGNNTTIDRAVMGSTRICKNAKIDNLVHIAHGVEIGENSLIIANAMIAGSTKIGKNVWVAPSASVLNKVTVGDNSLIGMGAVVLKNVLPGQVMIGNPAVPKEPKKV